jgi:hypothetical protein
MFQPCQLHALQRLTLVIAVKSCLGRSAFTRYNPHDPHGLPP